MEFNYKKMYYEELSDFVEVCFNKDPDIFEYNISIKNKSYLIFFYYMLKLQEKEDEHDLLMVLMEHSWKKSKNHLYPMLNKALINSLKEDLNLNNELKPKRKFIEEFYFEFIKNIYDELWEVYEEEIEEDINCEYMRLLTAIPNYISYNRELIDSDTRERVRDFK